MALRMPHPVALRNGVYHLNVRVPADVAAQVKGSRITLPIDCKGIVVGIRDKVIVSLRTKDPRLAMDRFAQAHADLARHWQLVRAGPAPLTSLTHKQAVAVAGVFYRQQVVAQERSLHLTPETLQAARDEFRAEVEAWRSGEVSQEDADRVVKGLDAWRDVSATGEAPAMTVSETAGADEDSPRSDQALHDGDDYEAEISDLTGDPEVDARIMALLYKPNGDALLAYRGQGNIDTAIVSITYVAALDRLFGSATDRLCQRLGISVDQASRLRLLREIGEAYRQAEAKLMKNMEGDYSPDPAANRFPELELPASPSPAPSRSTPTSC